MANESTQTPPATIDLTPEIVKSKLQIFLTKAEYSIQGLNDTESKLVYNEDNLETIKTFIENCKKAEKIVDDERVKLKEPYLQGGRSVDAGAKLLSTELATVKQKANTQYAKLCLEVERKQKEAETERLRIAGIREQMNNFKTTFATKIADAKTSGEIVVIERLFNLETANTKRYGEFIEEFRANCGVIRSYLSAQKARVRELEELELGVKKAAESGSDEQILEIMEKKEDWEAKIAENRVLIQEEAVKQASQPTESATVILPIIPKGSGRKLWKYEILDEKAANKAGLMKLVPDDEKIEAILKEKRNNEIETTENGIRYFIERRF